jgi:ATP-dependent helicase HrpB
MGLQPLPIDELLPALTISFARHPSAVLIAPPGAGKTTRVPPAVAAAPWCQGAVVMLQPRRVAARATASRIADEQGWRIGEEVGWHIRLDRRIGPRTKVRVLTEGILLRQIQSDPFLEGVSCVLLDEFHERSIHSDVALALLREVQLTVRDDLRLVVMSATLDPAAASRFLGDAPVFESAGRHFPVEVLHRPGRTAPDEVARLASEELRRPDAGHVLVFLPGIGEIRRVEAALPPQPGVATHILHSSVPPEAQDAALRPSPQPKLILATNIAETSLTIDGVRTVIDSGQERQLVHDTRLGIDRLELQRISLASARQRAGRAGRTAPGRCIRLWAPHEELNFDEYPAPEIHRIDLSQTLLALKDYGVPQIQNFAWYDAPPTERINQAIELLRLLGALDQQERLTPLGQQLARLPLHPRLGAILIAGHNAGALHEAAGIAALLGEKDLLVSDGRARRREAFWAGKSDVLDRLDLLSGDERDSRVDPQALRTLRRLRDELADTATRIFGPATRSNASPVNEATLRRILLHGYPDRVTLRRVNDPTKGLLVGGRGVLLEPASTVREGKFFLSIDPRDPPPGQPVEARVTLASAIDEEWLQQIYPHLLRQTIAHRFDEEKQRVLSARQTLFAGLVIREVGISPQDDLPGATAALVAAVAPRALEILDADPDASQWIARLRIAAQHLPEMQLPALDDASLSQLLKEGMQGLTTMAALHERGLLSILRQALPWNKANALEQEAPATWTAPSGSRIKIDYLAGNHPVVAVRLQELFGLAETPRLCQGRLPILLHLLGPNYRPVQVTMDLRSFWNGTYAEVRRELRARYPKHSWPDDPWNAPPVAKGRPRQ